MVDEENSAKIEAVDEFASPEAHVRVIRENERWQRMVLTAHRHRATVAFLY